MHICKDICLYVYDEILGCRVVIYEWGYREGGWKAARADPKLAGLLRAPWQALEQERLVTGVTRN